MALAAGAALLLTVLSSVLPTPTTQSTRNTTEHNTQLMETQHEGEDAADAAPADADLTPLSGALHGRTPLVLLVPHDATFTARLFDVTSGCLL